MAIDHSMLLRRNKSNMLKQSKYFFEILTLAQMTFKQVATCNLLHSLLDLLTIANTNRGCCFKEDGNPNVSTGISPARPVLVLERKLV